MRAAAAALTLLAGARFLQQQVGHTLPVLQHLVDLPQTVHQVRRVLVQLKQEQQHVTSRTSVFIKNCTSALRHLPLT